MTSKPRQRAYGRDRQGDVYDDPSDTKCDCGPCHMPSPLHSKGTALELVGVAIQPRQRPGGGLRRVEKALEPPTPALQHAFSQPKADQIRTLCTARNLLSYKASGAQCDGCGCQTGHH